MNTRRFAIRSSLSTTLIIGLGVSLAGCSSGDDAGTTGATTTAGAGASATSMDAAGEVTTCGRTLDQADPESVRFAAARTFAVGISGFDDASAVVDAGVRHLFIRSSTDRRLLDGQGDQDRSLAALRERAATADGSTDTGGTGDSGGVGGVGNAGGAGPAGITVSVDEEGGQVQRLADLAGQLPSAREMAATMSPQEVTELFTDHARTLRRLGITMDFAPDVDLDAGGSVSDNAIGNRAFSTDPTAVVEYGRAVIEGLLAGGVTPVIKHFPGHGHATGDSHTGAVSTPPMAEMGPDLRPFAELAQIPGVAVMVGHMRVPDLDAEGDDGPVRGADTPASLNPASYSLLRSGIDGAPGVTGQVFTDDLTGMRAVTDHYDAGEAVVAALRAGADTPLVSSGLEARDVSGVLDAVVAAVLDGRLDIHRLAEAADRNCAVGGGA